MLGAQLTGVWDTRAGHHLDEEQRMILSGPTRIRAQEPFPDAELGDNNQVQVALVIYFCLAGKQMLVSVSID